MGDAVPDSWDQGGNDADSAQSRLSAMSLNPNAGVFIPGKNIHATPFVPGGAPTPNASTPESSSPQLPGRLSCFYFLNHPADINSLFSYNFLFLVKNFYNICRHFQ